MKIERIKDTDTVVIELDADAYVDEIAVDQTVISVDETGRVTGLEIFDARQFGDPFDDVAARRAVSWAQRQVEARTAR